MRLWMKAAAALALGLGAIGVTAASADDGRDRDRDRDRYERRDRDGDRDRDYRSDDNRRGDRDRGDRDRSDDRRGDNRRGDNNRYDDRRADNRSYGGGGYQGGRPDRCTIDHDHRHHNRDYYNYYPKDRYYNNDPGFSISLNFGNGYYDRGGAYYKRPYYDQRGYRDYGRVVNREVIRLRGYRADAVLTEEAFDGRRGYNLVCTVMARGPDARYVPYGQLRSVANRYCSRRSEIRVYA